MSITRAEEEDGEVFKDCPRVCVCVSVTNAAWLRLWSRHILVLCFSAPLLAVNCWECYESGSVELTPFPDQFLQSQAVRSDSKKLILNSKPKFSTKEHFSCMCWHD